MSLRFTHTSLAEERLFRRAAAFSFSFILHCSTQRCTRADISSLYICVHNRHIHTIYMCIQIGQPITLVSVVGAPLFVQAHPVSRVSWIHCLQMARVIITLLLLCTHARTPARRSIGLVTPLPTYPVTVVVIRGRPKAPIHPPNVLAVRTVASYSAAPVFVITFFLPSF